MTRILKAGRFDVVQTFGGGRGWRFLDGHTVRDGDHLLGNDPPNVRVPADNLQLIFEAEAETRTRRLAA